MILLKNNLGIFSFTGLKFFGNLTSKFVIAIEVDILAKIFNQTLYENDQHPNEKIFNNIYYIYLPVFIASECDDGQYFDYKKYF